MNTSIFLNPLHFNCFFFSGNIRANKSLIFNTEGNFQRPKTNGSHSAICRFKKRQSWPWTCPGKWGKGRAANKSMKVVGKKHSNYCKPLSVGWNNWFWRSWPLPRKLSDGMMASSSDTIDKLPPSIFKFQEALKGLFKKSEKFQQKKVWFRSWSRRRHRFRRFCFDKSLRFSYFYFFATLRKRDREREPSNFHILGEIGSFSFFRKRNVLSCRISLRTKLCHHRRGGTPARSAMVVNSDHRKHRFFLLLCLPQRQTWLCKYLQASPSPSSSFLNKRETQAISASINCVKQSLFIFCWWFSSQWWWSSSEEARKNK